MPLNRTESIMMRVSPAVDARIRAAARDAGISVNELVNRAIIEWLINHEMVTRKP
jgi:predicted HicB family RNase H-like nuclease